MFNLHDLLIVGQTDTESHTEKCKLSMSTDVPQDIAGAVCKAPPEAEYMRVCIIHLVLEALP